MTTFDPAAECLAREIGVAGKTPAILILHLVGAVQIQERRDEVHFPGAPENRPSARRSLDVLRIQLRLRGSHGEAPDEDGPDGHPRPERVSKHG